MSFLAPWFLALGAAALVPLLIHLLRRRIGLTVEFPAARYLARAEREHSRTLRMRNLLLMLLRVVAVILLAAAAARPVARLAGAGHAPTALAIVIDNSLSTSVVEDGAPLLARFKNMAAEVLSVANPEDRLWIVLADGSVRGGTISDLRDELDRVRMTASGAPIADAVGRAMASVSASRLDARQVLLLTDGQRSAWTAPTHIRSGIPILAWAPGKSAPSNRAVILAEPRPERWTPRGVLAARVLSGDSTTYRMAFGDRTVARGTVAPGEEGVVRAAPAERGWTAGSVEIEPDELVADNVRHFAVWIGPAPAVRVTPGAGSFVSSAVDVLKAAERVVDGTGIQIASADEATTLPALLLPPPDPVRAGAANRALERLGIPWRFGPSRREATIAHGDQLKSVAVTMRYQLVPRGVPDAETLAVVGREPWLVSGPGYVLSGSPFAPPATSFPVSAGFLPWLGEVVSARLNSEAGAVRSVTPGQRVTRPAGADALDGPTGTRLALTAPTLDAPSAPGVYFFLRGARRVGALVVNVDPAESALERWSDDELATRIADSGARVTSDGDAWLRDAFAGVARRSLVVPLLIALLLVLAVETLVAMTGAGDRG